MKRTARAGPEYIELLLSRNQFQLETTDALYSDGNRYTPAVATVKILKNDLQDLKSVLLLGAGIGSVVTVIRKAGYCPKTDLVDINPTILKWALECLQNNNKQELVSICMDAVKYLTTIEKSYDLIFVDIFTGRIVPEFVTTTTFFTYCRNRLNPKGYIAFNYIEMNGKEYAEVKAVFTTVFPENQVIKTGLNRIFLARI